MIMDTSTVATIENAKAALQKTRVVVAGDGAFCDAIFKAVCSLPEEIEATTANAGCRAGDIMLAVASEASLFNLRRWQQTAFDKGVTLFPVHVQDGLIVIGPAVVPGIAGCLECWSTRFFNGRHNARRFAGGPAAGPYPGESLLTPAILALAAAVTAQRLLRYILQGSPSNETYYLDLHNLVSSEERLLPDPLCAQCGHKSWDSAQKAHLQLQPRPKPDISSDRLRTEIGSLFSTVRTNYVGRHAGLIREMTMSFPIKHVATVTSGLCFGPTASLEPCSGFCNRYDEARVVAMLEALERYSSYRLRSRQTAIHGSTESLRPLVVDPRRFGLPSAEEYALIPALTAYTDKLDIDWIWGYSLARSSPVLVPEQLAFYSHKRDGRSAFLVEGSNGCSLGSTAEEAILHGVLEVVERDTALMTWYARLQPPCFDPMEASHPEIKARCRRLQAYGYDVMAFDTTNDLAIPALLLVAKLRTPNPDLPCFLAVGAAHYRVEKALLKATRELTACFSRYSAELMHGYGRSRAHTVAENPEAVRTIEDHALFYCVPESSRHTDFLTTGGKRTTLAQMSERGREFFSDDLCRELHNLSDRILRAGCDVIVVDQTAPELSVLDMVTYKVLIPGAVPLTFGSGSRRLEGIGRLHSLLAQQGREIARTPHPFC
jgi:ribosomal protein S12 methylthiotransferase accessory factor